MFHQNGKRLDGNKRGWMMIFHSPKKDFKDGNCY